jgi:oligopeptide/dipeptide ABC transporter ATP-binding protein
VLNQVRQRSKLSVLWITHDPHDMTDLANRVLVFYGGELVEDAPAADLMAEPLHPYTRLLLAAAPPPAGVPKLNGKRLPVFSGPVAPSGCSFATRCPERLAECSDRQPELVQLPQSRRVRCVRYGE